MNFSVSGKYTGKHRPENVLSEDDSYWMSCRSDDQLDAGEFRVDYQRWLDFDFEEQVCFKSLTIIPYDSCAMMISIYADTAEATEIKLAEYQSDSIVDHHNGVTIEINAVRISRVRIHFEYNSIRYKAKIKYIKLNELRETKIRAAKRKYDFDFLTNRDKISPLDEVTQCHRLAVKLFGPKAQNEFQFILTSPEKDTYEISQIERQRIRITADHAGTAVSALNDLLQHEFHGYFNPVYGSNLPKSISWPIIIQPRKNKIQLPIRYILNFCTYSYTMPFWNEKE